MLALSGCDRVWQLDTIGAPVDALDVHDAPADVMTCYGTGLLRLCLEQPLATPRSLAGAIDTGIDVTCTRIVAQLDGPSLCVVSAQSIEIAGPLSLRGERPLVLVSDSSIRIAAEVDASSKLGGKRGPGGQDSCGTGLDGQSGTTGAGGGAAGTFNFRGGNGALGENGAAMAYSAFVPTAITDVRGGCPGFRGGDAGGNKGGLGGNGGGAFYAISNGPILITGDGSINASGSAGTGGAAGGGGGGGGGSGGMIVLDGTAVTVAGPVFARGGGAGAGGGTTTAGTSGVDPSNQIYGGDGGTAGVTGGGGGAPGCGGPEGEHGGFPTMNPAQAGGGGGGGSCGLLLVYGTRAIGAGLTSPAPD